MRKPALTATFAAVLSATALSAGPAQAACLKGYSTLMSCTLRGGTKEVSVCLRGQEASYRFGPRKGRPELVLDRRVGEVGYIPWAGVGRSIWEEFDFTNRGVTYAVSYSIDRLAPGNPITGAVVVSEAGRELARLDCDPGSVGGVLYDAPLMADAMEAAGLVWCWAEQEWRDACG